MAITCSKELPTGVTVAYHRVMEAVMNYDNGSCLLKIGSYVNEEVRRAGKNPVEIKHLTLHFSGGDIPDNPRQHFYEQAMLPPPKAVPMVEGGPPPVPVLWNQASFEFPDSSAC